MKITVRMTPMEMTRRPQKYRLRNQKKTKKQILLSKMIVLLVQTFKESLQIPLSRAKNHTSQLVSC